MSDIKILLVDDHAVVRMGFKMLIEAEPDMTVIAEAESGELGIKAFKEHKPDIVIMDITMPGIGGIEAIDRICAHDKSAKILVLSAHEDSVHPTRVLAAGCIGLCYKKECCRRIN
jgi:two-component system invasion response regulator UvrY